MQIRTLCLILAVAAALASFVAQAADAPIGIFESRGDVGITPKNGSIEYDAGTGEYRVTGGGANIWAAEDAFYFAWKRLSGDVTISADVRFVGKGAVGHRKAVLMIRQDLTPGAAYADIALHGDGLTSLQFRPAAGAPTQEIRSPLSAPTRLRIERRGNSFTISAGKPDGELTSSGPQTVELSGPVYAGIGVCSHDANVLETAVFSNVRIEQRTGGGFQAPAIQPTAEELRQVRAKVDEIDAILRPLKNGRTDEGVLADVEIYAKAGRWLLEFPQTFFTQDGINQALAVLDQGLERARQLQSGQSPWVARKGRKIHGYYSALDGSVQPYGLTVPESYDGSRPARLYVWLHGRDQTLSEASFIFKFPNPSKSLTYNTADVGQITLDAYGRWNNANHWAGEVDVFEAIAAVQQRYKIDPDRIILRGFSLGGAGAWHIALQHPDRFAAADIGAGTYPRRSQMPGFPPYQAATLRIWENILDWSLNAFNIPIAAHDGDSDTGVSGIPPEPGVKSRGQLESSLRVRAQLEKEGFPAEGEPNFLRAKGTPSIFLISANTGHNVSPLVREQVDAFLKHWGDRGRVSPDHIRLVTYTTRYDTSYWVSLNGLEKHYERAEVDAQRDTGRKHYQVSTKNLTHLTLRETSGAAAIKIDGQELRVKPAPEIRLEKAGATWRLARKAPGLRKTHGLQGPIDDAFLEPFLLVRPTGTSWNEAAQQQALRILARFDRVYARWYRAHPRIKDDRDVTEEDFAKYNVALFGDPGSNRWIARVSGKLPVRWTKDAVIVGSRSFAAAEHLPALVYPNPLHRSRYVVLNSGLTIEEREYQADYSMPRLGDFAVLKIKEGAEIPEVAHAGLFDESWQLPKEDR